MTLAQKLLLAGGVAACAIAAVYADQSLAGASSGPTTNDAYVVADFSTVAPRISGLIDRVEVADNQPVRAGQELAHIDDRDYRIAVAVAQSGLLQAQAQAAHAHALLARQPTVIAQARAAITADQASLRFAQANATRYHNLSQGGAGTVEQSQQSAAALQTATANLARDQASADAATDEIPVLSAQADAATAAAGTAQATLDQAQLNLSYTHIVAPVAGTVGARSLRLGNYVNAGTPLLAVVPLQSAYILANFRETQLTHMTAGNTAHITIDAFPGASLHGHVDSLAPANGLAFSPLPPDNATGNFTKVVQRFPLKIVLDPDQPLAARLHVGMSVEATVDTGLQAKTGSEATP